MRRITVVVASAVINASTIPSLAAECASNRDIDASRARWELLRSQPAKAADKELICRAYAASFYESVTLRTTATRCAGGERNPAVLDAEIDAFKDLLATKCGGQALLKAVKW